MENFPEISRKFPDITPTRVHVRSTTESGCDPNTCTVLLFYFGGTLEFTKYNVVVSRVSGINIHKFTHMNGSLLEA